MADVHTLLVELEVPELFLLHDSLLYYAEWASDELHASKGQRAALMRRKLLEAAVSDFPESTATGRKG